MLHETLTENIIKAFYTVYNALGYGFLEEIYENTLENFEKPKPIREN